MLAHERCQQVLSEPLVILQREVAPPCRLVSAWKPCAECIWRLPLVSSEVQGSVGQQAARPVRSAITGIQAGVHCIFPRKGCSGGRQRPPFTGGKGEITEIQSVVLKFLGERPARPRPPCVSHRCLPDVTLPPTPGEQQDRTRP